LALQIIFDPECSPEEYRSLGKRFPFPDLTSKLCPNCQGGFLKRHGFYSRNLVTEGFDGRILIRRHLCLKCGRTVSSLPAFAHPKRTYGISAIIGVLTEYYVFGKGVVAAAATGMAVCSRQLLRWFQMRIEANAEILAASLTGILRLRAPPSFDDGAKGAVRQILEAIKGYQPEKVSLYLFVQTGRSYLT
jgi:hypothetical protein